jgi:hypothetical protein
MRAPNQGQPITSRQLEEWLEQALVPVEPSPRFSQHLRARLVEVQGQGPVNWWMGVVGLVAIFLVMAAWLGMALRIAFALLGVLGLMNRARPAASRAHATQLARQAGP